MIRSRSVRVWASVVAGVAVLGSLRVATAQAPVPQTMVYAVYDNDKAAREAFDAMRDSQRKGVIRIDSFAVISKDQKGRVHVKSTQRRSARTGAIIGALVGILGGPVGMAAGAAAGGGIGFLTGNAVGISGDKIDEIKSSLTPGSSAIIAVIDERWAASLEDSLRAAKAKSVLDQKLASPPSAGGEEAPADEGAKPHAPPAEETPPPANP
jgi:uncharacterized membrane protein